MPAQLAREDAAAAYVKKLREINPATSRRCFERAHHFIARLRASADNTLACPVGEILVRGQSLRVRCRSVRIVFEKSVDKLAQVGGFNVTQIIQERCEALLI